MKKPPLPSRKAVKTVAKIVVANSVKGVLATAIATNVPVESKSDKVKLFIGTYAIGGMVAEASKTHIGNQIDSAAEIVDEVKKQYADYKAKPNNK